MILIKNGNNYIFATALHDGKDNKFIKLELIDPLTNNVIGTYSVNHAISGVYIKNDIPANLDGIILAKYTVYKDSIFTKLDKKYSINLNMIRVESIVEQLTDTIDFGDGSTV